MTTFLLDHDKPECIGCGACAAILPDLWVMEGDKAHVSGATDVKKDNGVHETLALKSQAEFDQNLEAAQACPVNCIHLLKDGVKAI